MAINNTTYYEQHNRAKFVELQHKIALLPPFVKEFFVGIELRSSVLTRINYAMDLLIFFDYITGNIPFFKGKTSEDIILDDLNSISSSDIESFLSYLSYYIYNGEQHKNGEKAKARKLSSVRSMFKYFYNKDKLAENVTSKVQTPKLHEHEIIRLDKTEVENVLNNVESDTKFYNNRQDKYNLNTRDRDIAILTLFLGTGIRVSELVGLDIDDINLDDKSFIVTRKGGNRTILFFTDEVKEALDSYIHTRRARLNKHKIINENALFLSLQDKRITVRAVENIVKKYTKTANPLKAVSPHKLRSTFGTELYRQTKDIYVVAEVLGHKDVNTTKKHYAALQEDIKREASTKIVLRDEDN